MASFKQHVGLVFFVGARLHPPPPLGESKRMRRVNIRSMADYDERQFRDWIRQAAAMTGGGTV